MNDLTLHLTHEAEEFERRGGTVLHVDQVLNRAGEIRRGRRLRATLVMAATVAAIAVPAGLVAVDRDGSPEPSPARPVRLDNTPLGLGALRHGSPPHEGYATGGRLQLDASAIRLPVGKGTVADVAPVGGGFLVAVRDEGGALTAHTVDEQGGTGTATWPMEGGFAVSSDGGMAAFVEPDGTPVVVQDAGRESVELPRIPAGGGFDAVALTGTTCQSPTDHVCAAWVRTNAEAPASWVSTPEGATRVGAAQGSRDTTQPVWLLTDVLDDGTRAGLVEVTDTGSCSAVQTGRGVARWSTCDHRLLSFSPDGRHLLASSAYADGAGDNRVTVLDAASGKALLDLGTSDGAFVTQMVWEDDRHVLATVADRGQWGILRIGLDGSREYAVAPVTGEDPYESPFVLASR